MQHLSSRHLSISGISQLLLTRFWWNFTGKFLGTSRKDSNCHLSRQHLLWWHLYISGISQLLLTRFGLNFKGKVKARSRQSQCKVEARLGKGPGKVMARSWQCQSQFRTRSGQVHGKVKERIRQGKSKVKARSRGKFNNSNSFNEYQINFYRPQLTPYEQLQQ